MMVLTSVYDFGEVEFAMFAGDDSLLFFKNKPEDANLLFQECFNLDSKIFPFNSLYFCSKFVLLTPSRSYVVPDPVKILAKLGRKDIRDYDHLEEYRVSLLDLTSDYDDIGIQMPMNYALLERYGIALHGLTFLIRSFVLKRSYFLSAFKKGV